MWIACTIFRIERQNSLSCAHVKKNRYKIPHIQAYTCVMCWLACIYPCICVCGCAYVCAHVLWTYIRTRAHAYARIYARKRAYSAKIERTRATKRRVPYESKQICRSIRLNCEIRLRLLKYNLFFSRVLLCRAFF